MNFIFLGTSAAIPNKYRQCSGLLIKPQKSKRLILFDCAEGTQIRIIQDVKSRKYSIENIDIILISHNHVDHISGLSPIVRTLGMKQRTRDLIICGPGGENGIKAQIKKDLFDKNYKFKFEIKFYEVQTDEDIKNFKIEDKNFIYRCVKIPHGDTLSLAYILKSKDSDIVDILFGDCTYGKIHETLAEKYRDKVRCLVHECTLGNELKEKPQCRGHSTPEMVVKFFKNIKPKYSFVTHFSARYHPKNSLNKWSLSTIEKELEGYPGIVMAEELEKYNCIK